MLQFVTGLFARGPDEQQASNAKKLVQSFKQSAEGDPEIAQLCEFAEREDLLSNWAQCFCNIDTSGNKVVDEQEFKEYVEKNKSSAEILKAAMHNYKLAVRENESDSLDESASGGLTFCLFMRMMRTLHSKKTDADGRVYEFLKKTKAKTGSVQKEDSLEKIAKIIEKAAGLLGVVSFLSHIIVLRFLLLIIWFFLCTWSHLIQNGETVSLSISSSMKKAFRKMPTAAFSTTTHWSFSL